MPRYEPLAVLTCGVASFIAWALVAGPDLNWDFLHYHLYVGSLASGDALSRDFFAAGSESYFTPYAYWPMAAMIGAGLPAMLVGGTIAAIHSLAALGVWYFSTQLFPGEDRKSKAQRIVSTVLGIASPVVLTQVGTSYIDLTAAIPGIFALGLLLKGSGAGDSRHKILALAGALFGIATALKFTNAAFAVSGFLTLATIYVFRPDLKLRALLTFVIGGIVGFLLVYGVWGYQLWREFGNPLFPFFDSLFNPAPGTTGDTSPSRWTTEGLFEAISNFRAGLHHRFLPGTAAEWLLRPVFMLDPVFNVYTETRAPDARYLALFSLLPLALWKTRESGLRGTLTIASIFYLFGWIAWMAVSGNGRYMMILILATGPLLVGCANAIWAKRNFLWVALVTAFVFIQIVLVAFNSDFRNGGTDWHDRWVSNGLPREVTEGPVTFVGFIRPSISWMTAFVHPQSRFMPLPVIAGPANDRDRVLRVFRDSKTIYAVFDFRLIDKKSGKPVPSAPGGWRADAERNGLFFDPNSCVTGRLNEANIAATNYVLDLPNSERMEAQAVRGFFFCPATFDYRRIRQDPPEPLYEALFKKIELACPSMYFPKNTVSSCAGGACTRAYNGTDSYVTIDSNGAVRSGRFGAVSTAYWGTTTQLLEEAAKIDCHDWVGKYVPWSPGENMFPSLR